jgi:hypothetical protein
METPPTHHDDDDDKVRAIYRTSYGDIGIVVIAAFCTVAFLLMMIMPSPIAKYEKAKAQQEKKERQEALSKPIPGGEVSVSIVPRKQ